VSFAAAEARANASVLARLANATASFGAAEFPVIFDNGAAAVMQGMADAAQPGIRILDSDLGAKTQGDVVTVTYNGVVTVYAIRNVLPDGTGFTEVALELAPV